MITALHAWQRQGIPIDQVWKHDGGLTQAAGKYFGSWRKAVAAAGILVPSRPQWTRERVLATLRAGGPWRMPPRSKDVPAVLASAAYRYFPTWHDALAAAGLVPLEPRPAPPKKWTKPLVIEAIRARHQQGLPLTATASGTLAAAARHCFGTWSNALLAAGRQPVHYRRWSKESVLEHLRVLHQHGAFDETTRLPDRGLMRAASIHCGSWRRALRLAGVLAADENWRHKRSWTRQRVIEAIQDLHVRGISLSSTNHPCLAAVARKRFGSWPSALAAAGLSRTGGGQ